MGPQMARPVDPVRRRLLAGALGLAPLLLAGCGAGGPVPRPAGPPKPFHVAFAIPAAGQVRLDYLDDANFRLEADAGPGATLAVDGEIYLHVLPSLVSQEARLLHLGRLGPLTRAEPRPLESVGTEVAAARRQRWGLSGEARRVSLPAPVPGGPAAELIAGDVRDLAFAQHAIGVRLRDSMDMALCGDVVGRLLATWARAVTAQGLAVLAHSSGIEVAGPLQPFAGRISLPPGLPVEDYRLRPA